MTGPRHPPGRADGPAHKARDGAGAPARRRGGQATGGVTPEACLRHHARRLRAR